MYLSFYFNHNLTIANRKRKTEKFIGPNSTAVRILIGGTTFLKGEKYISSESNWTSFVSHLIGYNSVYTLAV